MTSLPIMIDAAFDSGNIEVLAIDGTCARLAIRKDNLSTSTNGSISVLPVPRARRIKSPASTPRPIDGWTDYRAVVSEDRGEYWGRARPPDTHEDGGTLTIATVRRDLAWFAYFTPFSWERHRDLVVQTALADGVRLDCWATAWMGAASIASKWAKAPPGLADGAPASRQIDG